MSFWRKTRETEPDAPKPEPERVLTGIDRMELETRVEQGKAAAKEQTERQQAIQARIQQIETEIGPQLQELAALRQQLNPQGHWAQAVSGSRLLGALMGTGETNQHYLGMHQGAQAVNPFLIAYTQRLSRFGTNQQ